MLADRLKNEQMLNLVLGCLGTENSRLTVEQICSFPILQPFLSEINAMPDITEEIEEEKQNDSSIAKEEGDEMVEEPVEEREDEMVMGE